MTRYTNVALKRSYVQAGFNYREGDEEQAEAGPSNLDVQQDVVDKSENEPAPEAAKRKRRRKSKKTPEISAEISQSGDQNPEGASRTVNGEVQEGDLCSAERRTSTTKSAKTKSQLKQKRLKGASLVRPCPRSKAHAPHISRRC